MVKSFLIKQQISIFCLLFILLIHSTNCVNNKNQNIELNDKIDEKLDDLINYYKKLIDITDKKLPEDVINKNSTISFIQSSLTDSNSDPQVFEPFVWTELETKSFAPEMRRGHSSVIADNFMVIFGGCYMESTCYDDVIYLDLSTNTWIPIPTTGSIPSARQGHSAVLYGATMWVYGGSSSDGYMSDLYSLSLETVIYLILF
jgi:hypothetical protein